MADAKKIKFQIVGYIELTDTVTLETATAHLKSVAEKAREMGTAEVSMSVPRLTQIKV